MNEFVRLVEHGDYYFFAGDAVVLYGNKDLGIYKKISRLRKTITTDENTIIACFQRRYFLQLKIGKIRSSNC